MSDEETSHGVESIIHPDWPPLPVSNCSRQEVIDGLREVYREFLRFYKRHESPTTVGFPDYEKMLDYLDQHGLPPKN